VVGYASSALFDRDQPLNPVNRRIDIIVLTKKAQRAIEGQDGGAGKPAEGAAAPGAAPAGAPANPPAGQGEPLPPDQLKQKLNLFDDGGTLKLDELNKQQ